MDPTPADIAPVSAPRTIDDLPLELLELVFNLADRGNLKACTLVCRRWKETVYPMVFQHVRLQGFQDGVHVLSSFAAATHLFTHVRSMRMRHYQLKTACISSLVDLVLKLPHLRSVNVGLRDELCSYDDFLELTARRRIDLEALAIGPGTVMNQHAANAFLHLFRSVQALTLTQAALELLLNLVRPPQYRNTMHVRRLVVLPQSCFTFPTPVAHEAQLRALIDVDALEWLDDSGCGSLTHEGQDCLWPRVTWLRTPCCRIPGRLYPALRVLHLGNVRVSVTPATNQVDAPDLAVAGRSVLDAAPSLEEFSMNLVPFVARRLVGAPSNHEALSSIARELDWSPFITAVETHPLLHTAHVVFALPPGSYPDGVPDLEAALTRELRPVLSADRDVQRKWRFSVRVGGRS